jgi:DNA-binding NarL/FixJ family response regulator
MQPPVQVLGFGAASAPYLCDLLQSGAAGYLSMDETPEMIVAAVRGIACSEGEWLSRQAAAQLIRTLANRVETCNQITARQREVLALVAAGHTNRHIGQALGISEKTVEKHLGQLMVKMAVASRVEMAVQAVQKGWVSFAVPSVPEPAALSI